MSNAEETGIEAARAAYYDKIGAHDMAPLWEVLHKLVTPEPTTRCVPHLWRWADVRPYILEAGDLISAEVAERRVLILENPSFKGLAQATDTLYAGLQLILPGEVARAHRHTSAALRFIVEGEGAYTAVDGEKTYMSPGDFIITPSWDWHDHGHEGAEPVVWLDGLDLPAIHFYAAGFAEAYPDERYPSNAPPGTTRARYGANMKPVGDTTAGATSPIFSYPYAESRAALARLAELEDFDPCHGVKMEYINPTTGGPAMATISTFLQFLPKGFKSVSYRSTDHAVYSVVEGHGRVTVGPVTSAGGDTKIMEWGPKDHFAIPGWAPHVFEAQEDAVLFNFSDRVMQQKLDLWREQRG
ncbi:MAG: gentisate 1,2-dioxygenase [Alphaproteobacteria bacterium]|nr:gentisate 1,2-dioxygenase [Alphaproteobacteria bacterium]